MNKDTLANVLRLVVLGTITGVTCAVLGRLDLLELPFRHFRLDVALLFCGMGALYRTLDISRSIVKINRPKPKREVAKGDIWQQGVAGASGLAGPQVIQAKYEKAQTQGIVSAGDAAFHAAAEEICFRGLYFILLLALLSTPDFAANGPRRLWIIALTVALCGASLTRPFYTAHFVGITFGYLVTLVVAASTKLTTAEAMVPAAIITSLIFGFGHRQLSFRGMLRMSFFGLCMACMTYAPVGCVFYAAMWHVGERLSLRRLEQQCLDRLAELMNPPSAG